MAIQVPIDFVGRFEQAVSGFDKFQKDVKKKTDSLQERFEGLTDTLQGVAVAFGAKKLVDGFTQVISAAAESEAEVAKMKNALRLTGDYSDAAAYSFQKLAKEVQKNTRFDDDLIIKQVKLAKSFGTTNDQAQALILAAVDMAEYMSIDLSTAVEQLGKTLDGTAGKLAETVPGLRRFTAEQLKSGAAIEYVANRFRGAAADAANTYQGSLDQLSNALSNLGKSVGGALIQNDAFINIIKKLTSYLTALASNESFIRFAATIGTAVAVMVTAVGALGTLAGALGAAKLAAAALGATFGISLGPIGLAILAIGAIGGAVAYFATKNEVAVDSIDDMDTKLKSLQSVLREQEKNLKASKDWPQVYKEWEKRITSTKEQISELEETLRKLHAQQNKGKGIQPPKVLDATYVNKVKGEYESLYKSIVSDEERLKMERDENIKKLTEAYRVLGANKVHFFREEALIQQKYAEQEMDLIEKKKRAQIQADNEMAQNRERLFKEQEERINAASANPFSLAFPTRNANNPNPVFNLPAPVRLGAAAGVSGITSALNGKEGATNLLAGGAELAGQALIGVPGMGELFKALAKGPEETRKMIREFAKAVPDIIENVIDSIPVVIEELVDRAPEVIETLADRAPDIIQRLVEKAPDIITKLVLESPRITAAMVAAQPKIAAELTSRLVSGAGRFISSLVSGAGRFITECANGIRKALSNLGGQVSGGAGGFLSGAGSFVQSLNPFASGGTVPFGYNNDNFPARLSTGEHVIDRSTTEKLNSFLDGKGGGNSGGNQPIVIKIGQHEFARVLRDMNRKGYRTA